MQTAGLILTGMGITIIGERLLFPGKIPLDSTDRNNQESLSSSPINLQTFKFEIVTTDAQGEIINRRNREAKYFEEDLGNRVKLQMVQIPEGKFMMGSPANEKERFPQEEPQHEVMISEFFMGKYEVTQEQYQEIMKKNPSNFKSADRPVESVSWNDANEFCAKLSQKTGRIYRLPSESEWEYASRAGTTTAFYFGESITTKLVNYDGNYPYANAAQGEYRKETTPIGKFPPNAFGLYNMCGNVWEWCLDRYHNNYNGAPVDGSAWVDGDDARRLLRGGSWLNNARYCRSAYRDRYVPDSRSDTFGFRVVLVIT